MSREFVNRKAWLLPIIVTVAFAALPGAAQETGVEACAKLESDAERLACFDAVTGRQREGAETPVPSEPSTAEPAVSAVPETTPAAPPEVAPTQAEASVDTARPNDEQDLASSSRQDLPKEYTAVVVAMRERPHGQKVVTLDNGEVWSEQYASRAFLVKVGDTVTMKKGMLSSSYRLVAPGGRGYKMTRLE